MKYILEINAFGYELVRETVIKQILGKDSPEIMYWVGKQIARKFPLTTLEELSNFFVKASWGNLQLIKEKKTEMIFELDSPLIQERLKTTEDTHFQLESGFIAQQIEFMKLFITESYEEPKKKKGVVTFKVKWDDKDYVAHESASTEQ